eukprot:CAMPEP_0168313668 /NCGR_PEP_ID=MMETSP0210-20121227/3566_1 /TAXON_ID=40633 /ORGANISM="Condylostoma magnum, Strain COL2" /LENGTH=48 /DNA_ID= /DNA_START= /DNA_END= /DNA_ORIENTATION=
MQLGLGIYEVQNPEFLNYTETTGTIIPELLTPDSDNETSLIEEIPPSN